MKSAIVYYSSKSGNTRRIVEAISQAFDVTLIDVADTASDVDLSDYDLIGLASGIYYASYHPLVLDFINKRLPINKKVFLLFTAGCASFAHYYSKMVFNALFARRSVIMGRYTCPGRCTYGLFKFIGGIAKLHPTSKEIEDAVQFYAAIHKSMLSCTAVQQQSAKS